MGIYKGGPLSLVKGKVGEMVVYTTKTGYTVARSVGVRTAPFTGPELANQSGTALVTRFLKSLLPAIRLGFQNTPAGKHWTAYNYASSVIKINALKGTHPNRQIDYKKVILSVGDIPKPKNVKVQLSANQLDFTWDADMDTQGALASDRAMIVVFFPELMRGLTMLTGALRTEGKERFPLAGFTDETVMEIYISYIGANQKTVSDSVYAGQITNLNTI